MTIFQPHLRFAHFQLTRRCNLACSFCGQHHGLLTAAEEEMPMSTWLDLAEQGRELAGKETLSIMLWGGEPLLYPEFDVLAKELHQRGFSLSIVTNSTRLDRHIETVAECIDHIFISVDGPQKMHDAVRGEGVFQQVEKNVALLNTCRKGKLTFLCTVSDTNVRRMAQLPLDLAPLKPDEITLQPLMYLSSAEIEEFRKFSCEHFGEDYAGLNAWKRDDDREYLKLLQEGIEAVRKMKYPMSVHFMPLLYPEAQDAAPHCQMPWQRVHIRCDGAVGFCTDYFSFEAGNVKEQSLKEIFCGERAELFRKAVEENRLATCRHCPWRRQEQ